MKVSRAYLDHNATSPMRPEVVEAMRDASFAGNPSSIHREGRRARALIDGARARVAALVGAEPSAVIFTSGGSEANNAILRPAALLIRDGRSVARLVIGASEHASALRGHGFASGSREILPVDRDGRVDVDALSDALSDDTPALVSVQVANSETGAVQPIADIASLARARGAAVHADAVQAPGRIPLSMAALGLDALTVSGHKLGGPMGVGALVVAPDRVGPNLAFVRGGGQERGLRGGTENVMAIAGFGAAADAAARDLAAEAVRLASLRDEAERLLRRMAPDATVFSAGAKRLPNTLAFSAPGISAETALIALDLAGVAVSSGSACSSGKVGRSHVLAAMGVPAAIATGAIRVSFGWNSTMTDVARFGAAFENLLQRLYGQSRLRAA